MTPVSDLTPTLPPSPLSYKRQASTCYTGIRMSKREARHVDGQKGGGSGANSAWLLSSFLQRKSPHSTEDTHICTATAFCETLPLNLLQKDQNELERGKEVCILAVLGRGGGDWSQFRLSGHGSDFFKFHRKYTYNAAVFCVRHSL